MARAKEFEVQFDPAFAIIAKVLEAKRSKRSLGDIKEYPGAFGPGEHRIVGTVDYDIAFTKGIDSNADRFYGVPMDTILLLAMHYCGAMREYMMRAAHVVIELRKAELEGTEVDGQIVPRPYQEVRYTFPRIVENKRGFKIVEEEVVIPAEEVAKEADMIAGKLVGLDEESTAREQKRRALIQDQIALCAAKLKVSRPYEGPINIEDVKMAVHPGMVVEGQAEAA